MTDELDTYDEDADAAREREKGLDASPFFEYLRSEKGHELASRIVSVVEDIKKATLDRTARHATLAMRFQVGILLSAIVAVTFLSILEKFTPEIGFVFGALVGYMFGKRAL